MAARRHRQSIWQRLDALMKNAEDLPVTAVAVAGKGRGLQATRSITLGEVVVVMQEPVVFDNWSAAHDRVVTSLPVDCHLSPEVLLLELDVLVVTLACRL